MGDFTELHNEKDQFGSYRDENSQPFSIRKICQSTPKWKKAIFKSLIKCLKSQNINRNQSAYA